MIVSYSKRFIKQAKKLEPNLRRKIYEKISLFCDNSLHSELRNHPLKGKFKAYRSINVTSDVRAFYLQRQEEVIFDILGTRSQLYG